LNRPTKNTLQLTLLFLSYIVVAAYIVFFLKRQPFILAPFFLSVALIVFYLVRRHFAKRYRVELQKQNLQEKLNVLNDDNIRESGNNAALNAKILRYKGLKKIAEEINQSLDLDTVADSLSMLAFSLISNNKGTCLLYLLDNQRQKLSLLKTKKEDKSLVIKAKEGDIFDLWVLKHAQPLLMEDVKRDFRFDVEKLKEQELRPIGSLVSAPFTSENKFLGILRLDNPTANSYTQEDLRFLVTLCDLGAVALENSQLFLMTQDLAIHDELTGLYTKGYFLERLREECQRSLRRNLVFSLLMLDIDLFKNYNDKFGHTAGDMVLKNLSLCLVEYLKEKNCLISRFGGEEFCILLMGLKREETLEVAEGLRRQVQEQRMLLRRQETNITVSIGLTVFPINGTDENELIRTADMAMYKAKQAGRNRVACA
jgi:diguanylate cyclase (GGDEF)-like protein